MGKKPVVAIVGLIWAGMALVGCENCKNCRNKYNPEPAFGAKAGAPVAKQDSTPTPSVVTPTGSAAGKAETAKAADPVGTKGFDLPAVGTPASAGSTPAPTIQSTLSPNTDARPLGLPGQAPDYRSGERPISKSVPTDSGFRMPPRPVTPASASTMEPLPPISMPTSLPPTPPSPGTLPPPLSSTTMPGMLPQPPTSPQPMPGGSVNGLPSLDSIQK